MDAISKRLALQYPDDNKDWGALVRPLQEDMIGDARDVAAGAARRGRAGAADRVREPRQPDAGAHARPRQGNRGPRARSAPAACAWCSSCWPKGSCLAPAAACSDSPRRISESTLLKAAFGDALPRAGEVAVDAAVLVFTAAIALAAGLARRVRAGVAADRPRRERGAQDRARPRQFLRRRRPRPQPARGIRSRARADAARRRRPADAQPERTARGRSGIRCQPHLLTATIDIPEAKYGTPEVRNQFFDRALIERVRALPGVESAAWIDTLPLNRAARRSTWSSKGSRR